MGKYLRYIIENIEPLRIGDDATSQSGQTNAMRYVPGSAVRGLVVSELARENNFDRIL